PLRARLTAHRTAPRAPSIWDRMRSCTACKRRKVRRSTASRLGAALPVVSSATVRTSGPRAKVLELLHDLAHGRAVVAHRGMVPESSQGLDGSAPGARRRSRRRTTRHLEASATDAPGDAARAPEHPAQAPQVAFQRTQVGLARKHVLPEQLELVGHVL